MPIISFAANHQLVPQEQSDLYAYAPSAFGDQSAFVIWLPIAYTITWVEWQTDLNDDNVGASILVLDGFSNPLNTYTVPSNQPNALLPGLSIAIPQSTGVRIQVKNNAAPLSGNNINAPRVTLLLSP